VNRIQLWQVISGYYRESADHLFHRLETSPFFPKNWTKWTKPPGLPKGIDSGFLADNGLFDDKPVQASAQHKQSNRSQT
jgi:hypothetical protein